VEDELVLLRGRLACLEAEAAARRVMADYMRLCDRLDGDTDMAALGALFTADAVWAGSGARYGASFGGHHGRAAILRMLDRYRGPVPHFSLNVHFLTSERLLAEPSGDAVEGSWIMLQTSAFSQGGAHLTAARVSAGFRREDATWRIARFATENLFGRPIAGGWDSEAPLPVPAQHE
jgi:hypothetical protein